MPYSVRFRALKVNPVRINIPLIEAETLDFVESHMNSVIDAVRMYPPEPINSTYIRTGELGRGWDASVRRTVLGIEGTIRNFASDRPSGRRYMVYVQGRWQTGSHFATGWLRVDEESASRRGVYRRGLQAIYSKAIRKNS